jgi:predicted dehydrogenase
MLGLLNQLRGFEKSIKIGIVGIGSIGRGMVLQSNITPGIDCAAIADINVNKAIDVLGWTPAWDFKTTVEKTVHWYRNVNENPELARGITSEQIDDYSKLYMENLNSEANEI